MKRTILRSLCVLSRGWVRQRDLSPLLVCRRAERKRKRPLALRVQTKFPPVQPSSGQWKWSKSRTRTSQSSSNVKVVAQSPFSFERDDMYAYPIGSNGAVVGPREARGHRLLQRKWPRLREVSWRG